MALDRSIFFPDFPSQGRIPGKGVIPVAVGEEETGRWGKNRRLPHLLDGRNTLDHAGLWQSAGGMKLKLKAGASLKRTEAGRNSKEMTAETSGSGGRT